MNQLWNTTKTTLLLATLTGFFVVIGGALGSANGMVIALLFAMTINMAAWWFSDKMALKMSRARAVTPDEAPDCTAWLRCWRSVREFPSLACISSTARRRTHLPPDVRPPKARLR